jgi:ferredoxin
VKILRRVIQWSFFVMFGIGFLSFMPDEPARLFALLPRLQFFPAIGRYPLIALIILGVTFLVGRIYCSTLCPLATVQDLFAGRKRRYSWRDLSLPMRYLLPAVSLAALFAGVPALASVLDPYSMSGRMVSSINELIILPVVDLVGLILRRFSIYITTYPIQFRWVTIAVGLVSAAILYTLSRIGGRVYCNSLCPVGALLSIPARWSLFGFRIHQDRCTSCGVCEQVCKAEAIDSGAKRLDRSKCVSCFDCHSVCRFDALSWGKTIRKRIDTGRRDFLKKTVTGSILLLGMPAVVRAAQETVPSNGKTAVAVPPGSVDLKSFLSKCTSCSLCISRCLGNVLQPAAISQYGLRGFGVPFMDFSRGSCEYECRLCSELCPSGAIRPLTLENKKRVKIGDVRFIKELCVVETDKTSCGACGEICPTGAIEMVYIGESLDGALELPVIRNDLCIGCGACEFVCPVIGEKAIVVDALAVHKTAEKRQEGSVDAPEEVDNEFAF